MRLKISKKSLLLFLALIVIGLFVFFVWFFQKGAVEEKEEASPVNDIFSEPSSQIRSPDSDLWQKKDFFIDVLDEDLEFGLDDNFCQYKILSYDAEGEEYSTGWFNRKCNSFDLVSVGEGKDCGIEGEKSCWVFVRSRDVVGNFHLPSEENGSVKYYHIDWTAPDIEQISIEEKEVRVKVRDNLKIAACDFYLGNKNLGPMSFLVPGCQKECQAVKTLAFEFEPGTHKISAACRDAAGNYGWGSEELIIKENLPPEISFCRVSPSQGTLGSEFQFETEAFDPDGDRLTFLWDFGDGQTSDEKNPIHQYSEIGTFAPKVEVFDDQGGKDICSTAWVVVGE